MSWRFSRVSTFAFPVMFFVALFILLDFGRRIGSKKEHQHWKSGFYRTSTWHDSCDFHDRRNFTSESKCDHEADSARGVNDAHAERVARDDSGSGETGNAHARETAQTWRAVHKVTRSGLP